MTATCEYCQSACGEGALKCANCGAPLNPDSAATIDYRVCPHCNRRLLALGSPSCNYCGRHLPDSYVRAREAALRRIGEAGPERVDVEESHGMKNENDNVVRHLLNNLFGSDDSSRRK